MPGDLGEPTEAPRPSHGGIEVTLESLMAAEVRTNGGGESVPPPLRTVIDNTERRFDFGDL